MTNLIATKASSSGNNNFTGASNTFSNLPYYVNTSDQLINKNYVDGRFTSLLSANNSFTGSNTFSNEFNNGNTRRSSANYFECGMGQTSPYIYYDNAGKFGSVNTNDST